MQSEKQILTVEAEPKDECGVYGIYAPGQPVAALTYEALLELQHRGQNGAGVAVFDAEFGSTGRVDITRGVGLVASAIPQAAALPQNAGKSRVDDMFHSPLAIGHTRYSTGGSDAASQPFFGHETTMAVAYNGHIEDIAQLAAWYGIEAADAVSDSAVLTRILDARSALHGSLDAALDEILPQLEGAYCLTIMDKTRLIAVRDPWGFHPLSLGRLPGDTGYVVASETVAFTSGNAEFIRDIEPGEIVTVDNTGMSSRRIDRVERSQACMFEWIYTARPDSVIGGGQVYTARKMMGQSLARDFPAPTADVVVGVPSSGLAAAAGFAKASGLELVEGIFKNHNSRSFIMGGEARDTILRRKLRPNISELMGQSIVLVDDSLIKGNTMRALIGMLREAGVTEVHVRSAAPRYEHGCYMGMDTSDTSKLIARDHTDAEICQLIGADSIGFNSVQNIEAAVASAYDPRLPRAIGSLCSACVTGEYPLTSQTFVGFPKLPRQVAGALALESAM